MDPQNNEFAVYIQVIYLYICMYKYIYGAIHILRTHRGGRGRSVRIGILRMDAYGGEGRRSRQMRKYTSR